ncbi:MAG: SCO family protein [Polaromonas sp.]|nr:SCO family protein [Polaromonas sp.]
MTNQKLLGNVPGASGIEAPHGKRAWLKWMGRGALLPLALAAGASPPLRAAGGPRADYFPNSVVQTHDGRSLRFYDDVVRGRVVLFNMMYAVCTGICPGNTANLREVQAALGSRLGKDVFMVSMTLQPESDTPEVLSDYVEQYDIKPGWLFLTGKPREMDLIRRKLGFFNDDPNIDGDLTNHTGMLRLGNERLDRWSMMPALAKPDQIARNVLEA